MFFVLAKFTRAALLAVAVLAIPGFVAFPTYAEDSLDRPVSLVPSGPAEMTAARMLIESSGAINNVRAKFPGMADQLQRLAQNDPILRNVKFDVRQMALRLLEEGEEELLTEAAKAYAAYLTANEMQRISAFFRGPLGARFQLLPQAFAANHNVDRKKAFDEAATSVGFSLAEKVELRSYMRTADCQKFLNSQPQILVIMKEAAMRWSTGIAKKILDAAVRERNAQSVVPPRS